MWASASRCVQIVHLGHSGFRMEDCQWLCGETSNSPVEGLGEKDPDYVLWLFRALQEGIRDGNTLTRGRASNCIGRIAMASQGSGSSHVFSHGDLLWLCGLSSNTKVRDMAGNDAYTNCLERNVLAGERDGLKLIACKDEIRK